MAFATVQDLISFAQKAAGILGVGQSMLAEDNNDAFTALNAMLAQWQRRRWLIWHLTDNALVSTGAQSYTVGTGGDFDVPRPDRIEAAFFRQFINATPNQVDFPLTLLESREDYNRIALKQLQSWPYYIWYDADYPLGRVYPWPVPQAAVYEIHLSLKATLAQFASLTSAINLPPEYEEALWSNLAIRLAAIYPGASVGPATVGIAKAALETIRTANAQVPRLSMPQALSRPALYNILSDQQY